MSENRQNKGPSKPRVTMQVEVDRNGALVKEELPFEVLVMANFSGDGEKKDLTDRATVQINNDNFENVMESMRPTLRNLDVEIDGKTMTIEELVFDSMDKFSPEGLIEQLIEQGYGPIAELWKLRQKLVACKAEAGTNKEFRKQLDGALSELLKK